MAITVLGFRSAFNEVSVSRPEHKIDLINAQTSQILVGAAPEHGLRAKPTRNHQKTNQILTWRSFGTQNTSKRHKKSPKTKSKFGLVRSGLA